MIKSTVMTAETVGAAARYDPQLRIPLRPRLRRGLTICHEADEVVVYGGPKRHRFQGRSAATLLPTLLGKLDGVKGHRQLAECVGTSEEVIFKSVSLLWTCGVIEEGDHRPLLTASVDDQLADFLSRIGDSTGVNASWEEAAARLTAARVEVFGDDILTAALRAELSPSVTCELGAVLPSPAATLVVVVDGADPGYPEVVRYCWDNDIRLVRLRLRGRSVELGPFVDSQLTPCLDCLGAQNLTDSREPKLGDRDLAVALFAREIFALVSRSTPSPLGARWRQIDLEKLAFTDVSEPTHAGCANCSAAVGPVTPQAPLPVRYEASVAMPAKEFADLKAHQMHYKPSNLALQRTARQWPTAARIELPAPELGELDRPWRAAGAMVEAGAKVTPESLALVLMAVAGLRGTEHTAKVQRWTASGGNIGSCSAYVVIRDCSGLEPGVYGYVSTAHALARLSTKLPLFAGDDPVTIVLTGDYRKVAEKYGAFALRIVFLDSGCAQATARVVADVLSLPLSFAGSWDDQAIGRSLGLDLDVEPVTAVATIGGGR